ncbi:transglycosylase domain-containing protein [Streptomyces sp. NPDC093546]|uniref:transglycosylase domain-containing protein n=1 Tax=Streptomyces sp. NPDC093546 TaxID=3366040 RepID=UPI003829EED5
MGQAKARGTKSEGGGIRRFFTWKKLLGTFFGLCLLVMGAFYVLYLLVPVPDANAMATKQSNVYKFSNGKIFARTGEVNREIVGLDKIPKDVQYAFVAAENKTFFEDSGVDIKGTARGVFNTLTGKGKQGGSTITQQYVKNYYLTQDPTVSRKLQELVISLKVDQRLDKNAILAGYMNTSYYGRGAYGIQAAAQAYYGVDASELNVAQGAYLAAVLQAPSQYDWTSANATGRKLVTDRWNYVLDNMVEEGWLSTSERTKQSFPEPRKPKAAPGAEGTNGYLVEAANQELMRQGIPEAQLKAGGWSITLNIDEKRQKELVAAVDHQLEEKLDRKADKADATVQAGATSVDPKTGQVVALYGGIGATEHWLSNATRRDYQPASTFKPVVLASALDNGATTQDGRKIGLGTVYDGTSKRPVEGGDTPFAPENLNNQSYGPVTVQKATNSSINSVYAQMIVDVGPKKVKKTALDLGMKDGDAFMEQPAMSLGTMGASPWDMAGVYATFAHHGEKVTPTIVKSAEHKDRKVEPVDAIGERVLSREAADTVTKALTGVVSSGSGANAAGNYQAAGKTGTSENNRSAWFVGYTPELVTAVALFGEKPDGTGQVTLTDTINPGRANGGGVPAKIWRAYTTGALGGGSDARFDLEAADTVVSEPQPTGTPTPSPTPSDEPSDDASEPAEEPSATATPTEEPTEPAGDPTPTRTPTTPGVPTGEPTDGASGGDTGDPGGDVDEPAKPGDLKPPKP